MQFANAYTTAVYLWLIYCDGELSIRCVRAGEVRRSAERKRNPIRGGSIDWYQQPVRVFDDWMEWRPIDVDASQVPVSTNWLDNALDYVDKHTLLWPVLEALVDIAEAEESQGVAGGGGRDRDTQQTMALSGAVPVTVTYTTFAPTKSQALADRSTRVDDLSIAVCEAKSVENSRLERSDPHGPGYVYLTSMQNTQYYKIGMSLDPRSRLQMLQTGNPRTLRLARVEAVPDMLAAESVLHRHFEAQRVPDTMAREWFEFSDSAVLGRVDQAFQELSRQ